jgi:hypothetical protein
MDLIDNITNRYGKNKLTMAISYDLNNLSQVDKNIIDLVKNIEKSINTNYNINYQLNYLIYSLIYIHHSNKIIYNLPHMKNNIKEDDKPSLHIVFGETLSQLVAISLFTESLYCINKLCEINKLTIKTRNNIMELYMKNTLDYNDILDNKELLNTKFSDSIKSLYIKTLDISTCIYEDIINSKTLLSTKNDFKKSYKSLFN